MQLTFPVVSRFKTNEVFEPVTFEQRIFSTTRSKVIRYAFTCGWKLENGHADSIRQIGGTGGLAFWSQDNTRRVNLDFGSKGQITWCCITNTDTARDGKVVPKNRYAVVLSELNAGRAAEAKVEVPNIPVAPKPEVLAYREIASLRQNDHVTLWTLSGQVELLVISNQSGDNTDYSLAQAICVERHTRVEVRVQARDLLNRKYSIRNRWHDDQDVCCPDHTPAAYRY